VNTHTQKLRAFKVLLKATLFFTPTMRTAPVIRVRRKAMMSGGRPMFGGDKRVTNEFEKVKVNCCLNQLVWNITL